MRKATIEQRFLSYAIKGSSGRTAREILCGIRDNLDELSASFRDTELKKIENRLSAALKDPESRDAALSRSQRDGNNLSRILTCSLIRAALPWKRTLTGSFHISEISM